MSAPVLAPPLLQTRGLCRRYGDVRALDDVSITVERGEVVALVGESGSGKSTLARCLVGMEAPDAGEIRFTGAPARRKRPVQMVFQDPFSALNPVHTVLHHVERPLVIRGVADARGEALDLLASVGLGSEFARRRPHELSGGQRQRVVLARALAAEPELLVADEPTSMLDVSIRAGVLDLLATLAVDRGLGILLVTHDLASARAVADRIVVLYGGRVVEEGPAERVIANPGHPYTRRLLAAARWSDA
ncbi:MAG: ABC transporter ATP-binding protein [Myxococcota bacterium]